MEVGDLIEVAGEHDAFHVILGDALHGAVHAEVAEPVDGEPGRVVAGLIGQDRLVALEPVALASTHEVPGVQFPGGIEDLAVEQPHRLPRWAGQADSGDAGEVLPEVDQLLARRSGGHRATAASDVPHARDGLGDQPAVLVQDHCGLPLVTVLFGPRQFGQAQVHAFPVLGVRHPHASVFRAPRPVRRKARGRSVGELQLQLRVGGEPVTVAGGQREGTEAAAVAAFRDHHPDAVAAAVQSLGDVVDLVLDVVVERGPAWHERMPCDIGVVDEQPVPAECGRVGAPTHHRHRQVQLGVEVEGPWLLLVRCGVADPAGLPLGRFQDSGLECRLGPRAQGTVGVAYPHAPVVCRTGRQRRPCVDDAERLGGSDMSAAPHHVQGIEGRPGGDLDLVFLLPGRAWQLPAELGGEGADAERLDTPVDGQGMWCTHRWLSVRMGPQEEDRSVRAAMGRRSARRSARGSAPGGRGASPRLWRAGPCGWRDDRA